METQTRGAATTGVLVLLGGWLSAEAVHFRRGDVNADGQLTLTDPVVLLEHLFQSGELPCRDAGDWNDDGKLDLGDAVNALSFLFLGGVPAPEEPRDACGADFSLDELDCAQFPACDQPLERDWTVREVDGSGQALALDPAGNIYVVGETWGGATNTDYITLKYDGEGKQLWRRQFDVNSNAESAYGIGIDRAGNACVVGHLGTVKYGSETGEQLWVAPFDGANRATSSPKALVLDPAGNPYVTGFRREGYATVKYDPSGQEIWVARYPSSGGTAYPYAMALDREGNVLVTGEAHSPRSGSFDYATVKYDPRGNELWAALFDGGRGSVDRGRAVAVGSDGSVHVTGDSGADSVTIRYAPNGQELWATRFRADGREGAITYEVSLDRAGNTYAGGGSRVTCEDDSQCIYRPLLLKFDPDGVLLWARERAMDQRMPGQSVRALFIDADASVFVATGGIGVGQILKYDPQGQEMYAVPWVGTSIIHSSPDTMAVDGSGQLYLAGHSYGEGFTVDGNPVPILTIVKFTERR